ncbi:MULTISPECIES: aldehyde dehydrogenase family protein [unclassified Modicisalibacter]|uniref:aldehyde dehydrogenase family protein n=1 Tax=unclassified Modicisalibacter TaxID=2679913 RepID=UPI001CCF4432|nr:MULTISPECIES: aldehyde dehydrogenase family protein [unclassified Modicisalibacter]MBZ9557942.1 aldehyde dehydrogenase family protein [Modicisalibacter sp. R2A 31.J]MBZ9573390.1 aldehyde dehydrogenase family protein [Modicisalibacter sp. MOD 31.J]
MTTYTNLYIDGQWVAPVLGKTFPAIDPSDEGLIAEVASATVEDVDAAVRAARAAFDNGPWPTMSGEARAGYLRRVANGIRARIDELAQLEVRDNGKPLPEAIWDIEDTAGCFDFYADLAERGDEALEKPVTLADDGFVSRAIKQPVGVVAAITPWNFPMLMASWKVAPAIAAGCTVILKPSEVTSLTALELAAICDEAEIPPGVVNILPGTGAEAGAPLTEHPLVDKIAFTGSVPTGSRLMKVAAQDIKNISLELGGKSPLIIFDDCDLEEAVEWLMFGIFWNKGEVCSATSRVLVQEDLYPKLLDRLVEEARKQKIGNGLEQGVLLGPLVNAAQYEKVTAAIAAGKRAGATLLYGGERPAGLDQGYYLEPAIFVDVPEESDLWKEEVFGPVVAIRRFATEDEAVRVANDSEYGLAGAVMSKDLERCERVARALRAGIIWINCSQPTFVEAPWGGYKKSGIGRELGEWGYENYFETKQITRYISDKPWGWFIK